MAPIDEAIADLESREAGDNFSLRGPRAAGYAAQQLLSPQQEEGLVSRFINRNHDHFISKWSASMDVYKVEPCNTYNINKKGFMIGVTGRLKWVFSRLQWEEKKVRAALQDGSREWVTVVATIRADGSVLPPALIYSLANCTL
ncbi:hypothetical protein CC80DRAFT_518944 [Byssothecium circinans]|uniref:Uncharacterized protein n=1 Tax=Byssothecium circinans TaxID=147558 RepID=A0A6A5TN35_9PLEO|nr:hypothetical protein CC80DRAFT_518944 [Byssothecium circinans]